MARAIRKSTVSQPKKSKPKKKVALKVAPKKAAPKKSRPKKSKQTASLSALYLGLDAGTSEEVATDLYIAKYDIEPREVIMMGGATLVGPLPVSAVAAISPGTTTN